MNVLLAETVGFGEGAISVNNIFLVFEIRDLVHENFDSFFFVGRIDHDFVEGIGEGGILGGDFEEFLVVHNHDDANLASFNDGGQEITDIDGAGTIFEKEMSVVETENDIFGGINFV